MSIEYYLFCRKKYEDIINNLLDIINAHTSMIELLDDDYDNGNVSDDTKDEYYLQKQNIMIFEDNLQKTMRLKKDCNLKINCLCEHEFIDDVIDITLDESKHISYCVVCGYTK